MPQKTLEKRTRVMTEKDIEDGLRLNTLAGWNQTASDWRRFLEKSPDGCFVTEVDGKVVGTAATVCYENRFAYVGMVLVDSEFRNMGIGTQLLQRAIEHLDRVKIPAIKLDATPLGRPIYSKLGFVPEYEIERWMLKRSAGAGSLAPREGRVNLNASKLDSICEIDRELFGADRRFLLRSLHEQSAQFSGAAWKNGVLRGYAFGRQGLFADHLGPWMAEDRYAGQELLESFLRQSFRETIIVDCLKLNSLAMELAASEGFTFSRPLTRMVRGPNSHPGKPAKFFAILGPEFG